jgi:hypothetical protein
MHEWMPPLLTLRAQGQPSGHDAVLKSIIPACAATDFKGVEREVVHAWTLTPEPAGAASAGLAAARSSSGLAWPAADRDWLSVSEFLQIPLLSVIQRALAVSLLEEKDICSSSFFFCFILPMKVENTLTYSTRRR